MSQQVLLGMLTPSSNTALEPITSAMVSGLPEVSAHFGRFRVTEISLKQQALAQFNLDALLHAAELLADAQVDVIAWNGTSSGWLGFKADLQLCEAITSATGIPATTSVLALLDILRDRRIEAVGLVTPYLDNVQDRIVANFAEAGIRCIAERHLNLSVNFSFSEVSAAQIASMVRNVAASNPQAIMTFCTNLRAAPLVNTLEQKVGIPIYDTISVVVWKSLMMAGINPARVQGWGSLFTVSDLAVT